MPLLLFPAEIEDHVFREDFEYPYPDGRLRTKMDRGPAKTRGDSGGFLNLIPCSIPGSRAKTARLQRFWAEETGRGNKPFLIRDQQFDGAALGSSGGANLTSSGGAQLTGRYFWRVRFGERPPVDRPLSGAEYRTYFELERLG